MSKSWDRVADEALERRARARVIDKRFWTGFLGMLAFMALVSVGVSWWIG